MSVVLCVCTLLGVVVVNTVSWERLAGGEMHQEAIALLIVVFGVMFAHVAYGTWTLVQAPPHASSWNEQCATACCASVEMYYALLMLAGGTCLRMYEVVMPSRYERLDQARQSICVRSLLAIALTGFAVAAFVLQCFASFGKFGTPAAMFVPIPASILCVLGVLVETAATRNPGPLVSMWCDSLKAGLCAWCALWPLIPARTGIINSTQLAFVASSAACQCAVYLCLTSLIRHSPSSDNTDLNWQF